MSTWLMATVLMLTGIGLLGTLTAAVAAWFVTLVRNAAGTGQAPVLTAEHDLAAQIAALAINVDQISDQLSAMREEVSGKG